MPKLLYIGLKNDYGIPSRGFSFEYLNTYQTLINMRGIEADLFPFDEVMRKLGRVKMNIQLLDLVESVKPDICFFTLFTDEIMQSTIKQISDNNVITLNWFGDDHWRFDSFSRHWAPLFSWSITTDRNAYQKYKNIGLHNIILCQWGFNHYLYQPSKSSYQYDVTFIGQVHSRRIGFIESLRNSGINVECWGNGWPNGRIDQREMIRIYSQSRINLNFTDSSPDFKLKPLMKAIITRRADDSFRLNSLTEMKAHILTLFMPRTQQIKGRNFEIPGTGGFLITQNAPGLDSYFRPEKEIVIFTGTEDLIEKVKFYLNNDEKRENIRHNGHMRAVKEHSFQTRLESLFSAIGITRPEKY